MLMEYGKTDSQSLYLNINQRDVQMWVDHLRSVSEVGAAVRLSCDMQRKKMKHKHSFVLVMLYVF
jgi:hypothetical protein